jgi:hypothetical protein
VNKWTADDKVTGNITLYAKWRGYVTHTFYTKNNNTFVIALNTDDGSISKEGTKAENELDTDRELAIFLL